MASSDHGKADRTGSGWYLAQSGFLSRTGRGRTDRFGRVEPAGRESTLRNWSSAFIGIGIYPPGSLDRLFCNCACVVECCLCRKNLALGVATGAHWDRCSSSNRATDMALPAETMMLSLLCQLGFLNRVRLVGWGLV